jgi:hypothetical protein
MVALLTSERLQVLVLLDDEPRSRDTKTQLVKQKLIREDNVVFVSDGFDAGPPPEADVEDLIDPLIYEELVRTSYRTEIEGKTLSLNASIPRIVKRYEDGFRAAGLEFHKTRPARLMLEWMARDPKKIMTADCTARFERLFSKITEQLDKHLSRAAAPFR